MKLEQQIISLELAKKLKELGIKQESLFYWSNYATGGKQNYELVPEEDINPSFMEDYTSALTVAELFELTGKQTYLWKHPKDYVAEHFLTKDKQFTDVNSANALAKMLIYLLENKLITKSGGKK